MDYSVSPSPIPVSLDFGFRIWDLGPGFGTELVRKAGGGWVACRIILSAPVPVPFLWTLDFEFMIWDLDLGLGFGTWI